MTPDRLTEIKERLAKATPEEWRKVPFSEEYEVSNWGNVRTRKPKGNGKTKTNEWRLLKPVRNGRYRSVCFRKDGTNRHQNIHRLVMAAFVGPCPEGMEVAHLNGLGHDNRLENLKYCTHKENEAHKREHGTAPLGENNGESVLQDWQVAEIKYLSSKGLNGGKIAALFDISHKTVSDILRGKSWSHVDQRTDLEWAVAEIERQTKTSEMLRNAMAELARQADNQDDYIAKLEARLREEMNSMSLMHDLYTAQYIDAEMAKLREGK